MNLLGGEQVRHWIDHMALDGSFQVARPIPLIRAFLQKKIAAWLGHAEEKLPFGRFQYAVLHLGQFNLENLL